MCGRSKVCTESAKNEKSHIGKPIKQVALRQFYYIRSKVKAESTFIKAKIKYVENFERF